MSADSRTLLPIMTEVYDRIDPAMGRNWQLCEAHETRQLAPWCAGVENIGLNLLKKQATL